ncbi:MAG: hypothetical protein US94_C0002G0005 [Berkelbacteria bacterium GW2011_GWB1_38_5]|uniref:Uncharacterized protein n=2 Tax=Candidatus Berkelbacteria TaxID=1618330 RepID=A0A0G0LST7_9BACT|nr:MAG: hypothetical protein US94_C0002G0005 [Berkelbacteria bacterium GW2011_GWB1_38_5]KKQ91055.1 MAG: hypothetical protein UT15_C0001G0035 [Berkelbacteria bacterium GW2011_GWA1_39_10]
MQIPTQQDVNCSVAIMQQQERRRIVAEITENLGEHGLSLAELCERLRNAARKNHYNISVPLSKNHLHFQSNGNIFVIIGKTKHIVRSGQNINSQILQLICAGNNPEKVIVDICQRIKI